MARIITFYVPRNFQPQGKAIKGPGSGTVIEFRPAQGRKPA
jgi:hypothetical protein